MDINAGMVKDLRECTGAGMMDCKKALQESDGDMDAAIDLLRTKGLAALAKKAGRATNEGLIGASVSSDAHIGVLAEVNCETDFVARNADFKAFVDQITEHVVVAAPADVEGLMSQEFADSGEPFEQVLGETVGRIGENMGVARFVRYELEAEHGRVSVYIHGVGNIGVMVELTASSADAASSDLCATAAKDVAMQIAATSPLAVSRDSIDQATVDHEMEIYKAQAAESGKPEPIQEKIAQGRLQKYFKEVALIEQAFVKDSDISVGKYIENTGKELGATLEVTRFERFLLGESSDSK